MRTDVFLLAVLAASAFPVGATGPEGGTAFDGTVKVSAGIPRDLFVRQMPLIESRRASWLTMAEAAKPALYERNARPARQVRPVADAAAFLGWRFEDAGAFASDCRKPLAPGDVLYLDFGEHLTGRFSVRLGRFNEPVDAPVRLRLTFGEVPGELLRPFSDSCGISTSWRQEEVLTVDDVPSVVEVPRRLSFRFVRLVVDGCSPNGRFCIEDAFVRAQTSADEARLVPFAGETSDAEIDRVANRTLRECMQTVLEDGPKRDRRLWLGDLRLQALANYETYRNFDVVKRSILVLAGTCATNGLVSTAAYEHPFVERANVAILDYTALFANVVEEYLAASGDRETCESLWPLVLKQADFTLETVGEDGLVREELPWWQFIYWQPAMKHQAAEQAAIVFSLRALERLGKALGREADLPFVPKVISLMTAAAQERLWNEPRGVWVSNGDNVSWMNQAWMVLSGIATSEQARRSLAGVMALPDAIRPVTPYAHHYFVEALFAAGLHEKALAHVRGYWGGMVKLGADTFWEVWVPDEPEKSPYGNVQINSFCHAWSCTAGYLLRKYASRLCYNSNR